MKSVRIPSGHPFIAILVQRGKKEMMQQPYVLGAIRIEAAGLLELEEE